jgi:hypothetical protein
MHELYIIHNYITFLYRCISLTPHIPHFVVKHRIAALFLPWSFASLYLSGLLYWSLEVLKGLKFTQEHLSYWCIWSTKNLQKYIRIDKVTAPKL